MFTTSVPNETAFRIWDLTFLNGPQILFETAISILKMYEKQLLAIKDDTEAGVFLLQNTEKLFDSSRIFDEKLKPIEGKKIAKLRDKYQHIVNEEKKRTTIFHRTQPTCSFLN